jgi:Ca2+-binding RTX toxin-like protein
MRLNSDGSLDSTFGLNGLLILDFDGNRDYLFDMKLRDDGVIVAAGFTESGSQTGLAVALIGTGGDDALQGTVKIDKLYGFAGDDVLDGGVGADELVGGDGNDTYLVENLGDLVSEVAGEGADKVIATVDYALSDQVENLDLGAGATKGTGNALDNIIRANDVGNELVGGGGNDQLRGGKGNDKLYAGDGDDVVDAGEGNDQIVGGDGAGNDTYIGGAGIDKVIYTSAVASIQFNLVTGSASGPDIGSDTLSGIENILGGQGDDNLVGDDLANEIDGYTGDDSIQGGAGNDKLLGGDGNDSIDGGAGVDALVGGAGNDTYVVDLLSTATTVTLQDTVTETVDATNSDTLKIRALSDTINTSAVTLTLAANLENYDASATGTSKLNLNGNTANNTLTGNSGNNILDGKGGADTLIGGDGNDTYVVDNAGDIVTEDANKGTDLVQVAIATPGSSYTLTADVENAVLTNTVAFSLTGNTRDNVLTGNAAINTLAGGEGDDTLDGKGGVDIYVGGLGNDTYIVDLEAELLNITEDAAEGTDTLRVTYANAATTAKTITLAGSLANLDNITVTGTGLFNLTGNDLDNVLTGNASANRLNGGVGADTLVGGLGNDTYVVDDVLDVITETSALSTEIDTVESSIDWTLGTNLEKLTLTGSGNIDGAGNTLANTLQGNTGNNRLDGGTGADIMLGGAGNDTYVVDNVGDKVYETTTTASSIDATGIDTVEARISYTLGNFVENLTLTGSDNINGNGNGLANTLTGNTGNNVLDGKAGADTLVGGEGSDIYLIGLAADHTSDEVIADSGASGIDEIRFAAAAASTLTLNSNTSGVERVVIGTGTGAAAISTGTLALNVNASAVGYALDITGNAGANTLTGTGYGDTLNGGAGNDRLDGGAGADRLKGGTGNDTYVVDNADDVIEETSALATEIDTVEASLSWTLGDNLEKLVLTGSSNLNGTGNGLNNTLTGNSGNNRLDGGTGADIMLGGAGNDTYVVDNVGDKVYETTTTASTIDATGIDTVEARISYTLGNFVENLTLTGSDNINGTGNGLANTLTGIIGNNVLNGAAGNDSLNGGGGNDVLQGGLGLDLLIGGDGDDIFRFDTTLNSTTNVDTIQDFVLLEDVIQLENSVFTKLTVTGQLAEANFRGGEGVTAQDTNDFILYDTSSGALYYDADGSGVAAAVQFATLIGQPTLRHADFYII